LNLNRNLGKTNPLTQEDLADFLKLQKIKADSQNSWTIKISEISQNTFDLSVKNPNKTDEAIIRQPKEILKEMAILDKESQSLLKDIDSLL
jgi:type I restriction enzyme M protein